MSALPQAIAQYTLHEKIQLVEDIWGNIAEEAAAARATSEAAQAEIMRRVAWRQANPEHGNMLRRDRRQTGRAPVRFVLH